MTVSGRVGYAVAYVGLLAMVMALSSSFSRNPDILLLVAAGVLLLAGLLLLMREPLARKLKWRLLFSSSPTGSIGVAVTLYGVVVLLLIVRPSLLRGDPASSWWLYLLSGIAALALGIGLLVVKQPIKDRWETLQGRSPGRANE